MHRFTLTTLVVLSLAAGACKANDGVSNGNNGMVATDAGANVTINANVVEVDQFGGTISDNMTSEQGATGNMIPTDQAIANDLATANALDNAAVEAANATLNGF